MGAPDGWAWLEGRLLDAREARLCVLDRGLQYGDGVFETLRAERGKVFFLAAHLARLERGLGAIDIPSEGVSELARRGLGEVLSKLRGVPSVLKVIVTRGASAGPTVLVTGREDPRPRPEALTAVTASFPRNERSPLVRIKSLNYLEMVLARMEATRAGVDEALLLNTRSRLAESSAANIFAEVEGRLLTPREDEGCLPGIVRQQLLALAGKIDVEVAEGTLSLEELRVSREAFLTNSRIGVATLASLDGARIGDGRAGRLTSTLKEAFRQLELSSGEEP